MRARREHGQALIETILVGLLLLVPLIWTLGVLGDLHRSALAATAAAREAGADATRAVDPSSARRAIDAAVGQAFSGQGLDPDLAAVHWSASPDLERGGFVEIEVTYPVTVLQVPFIGRVAGPSIIVRARHLARIDPFRSRE